MEADPLRHPQSALMISKHQSELSSVEMGAARLQSYSSCLLKEALSKYCLW
jgi:hypothetical protein